MADKLKPTAAELEILDVLWQKERATVGDVHTAISERRPTAYTTILKLMQIMLEKGLVRRSEKGKAHVYWPAQTQKKTRTMLVSDLLDKAFQGSALKLVLHVLETEPASRDELDQIRALIRSAESKGAKQ
jgi:predicted transcriptional regulator